MMDNTWATPLFFSAHAHGVDIAIEAGTKYLSGHSDLLLGLVRANEEWFARLHRTVDTWRFRPARKTCSWRCAACARSISGCARRSGRRSRLRNGSKRAPKCCASSIPPCPIHPRPRDLEARLHGLVRPVQPRAATGAAGGRRGAARRAANCSASALRGAATKASSFPSTARKYRTATRWAPGGPTLRLSVGLEDIEDLKEDFDRGFARLRATA